MTRLLCLILMCALLPRAATAQEDRTTFGTGASRLDVRSTTDIDIIRPVMERFVEANPDLSVNYEQWGSNNLFRNSRDACAGRIPAAQERPCAESRLCAGLPRAEAAVQSFPRGHAPEACRAQR